MSQHRRRLKYNSAVLDLVEIVMPNGRSCFLHPQLLEEHWREQFLKKQSSERRHQ